MPAITSDHMSDALFAALFQKFFELNSADPKYYTKSLAYARTISKLRRDKEAIKELNAIEKDVASTSIDIYTLETAYYSLMDGQLNTKIKIEDKWYATVDVGRILDLTREKILMIFTGAYFEEPMDFGIEQLGAKQ